MDTAADYKQTKTRDLAELVGEEMMSPMQLIGDHEVIEDDITDMSKPPTGHHPGETGEAERSKHQGPDHMRHELNPTTGGTGLNKGQERRQGERRKSQ